MSPIGTALTRSPATPQASLQILVQTGTWSWVGSSMRCTWRSALCGTHGLQVHSLLHHGPLLVCVELLLYMWNICFPSALVLLSTGLFLTTFFSLHFPTCCCIAIFPFLKSTLSESQPLSLMAQLWQRWVPYGAAGAGCDLTWSNCWVLLSEAAPEALTLPSLATLTQCTL